MPKFQISYALKTPLVRGAGNLLLPNIIDPARSVDWVIIQRITIDLTQEEIEKMRPFVSSEPLATPYDQPLKIIQLFLKKFGPKSTLYKDPEVEIIREAPSVDSEVPEDQGYIQAVSAAGHDSRLH